MDNEHVQEALRLLLESVKSGKEFVVEQAPLLAQEIIVYGRATYTSYVAVCVLLLIVCGYWIRRNTMTLTKRFDSMSECEVACCVAPLVACVVVSIVATISFLSCIDDVLMAWFAPRLYLLEYLARVVK